MRTTPRPSRIGLSCWASLAPAGGRRSTRASSVSLEGSVQRWRDASDDLLRVAQAAAPLPADDLSGLSLDAGAVPADRVLPVGAEVERRVDALIEASEAAISDASASGDHLADGLPVLLGALEVTNTLLLASDDPDDVFAAFGVDADGGLSLAAPRAALNEFREALLGRAPVGSVPLPAQLEERLEKLESTGAEELLALGQTAVLTKVVGDLATGAVSLLGSNVEEAFDWLKNQLNLLRKAAVRLLKWVVTKFRDLVPESYLDDYDEKIKDIAKAMEDGALDALGNTVGFLAGRREVQKRWLEEMGRPGADVTDEEAALADVINGHLKRIGYVSRGRVVVSGSVAVLRRVTGLAGPNAEVAVAAAVAALIGFVWFQLVDGYNDIEDLLPEPVSSGAR